MSACGVILSLFLLVLPPPPSSTLFPYTTLFRSPSAAPQENRRGRLSTISRPPVMRLFLDLQPIQGLSGKRGIGRSEEHTSELQSLRHLVCRLLLEKKKKIREHHAPTTNHSHLTR